MQWPHCVSAEFLTFTRHDTNGKLNVKVIIFLTIPWQASYLPNYIIIILTLRLHVTIEQKLYYWECKV